MTCQIFLHSVLSNQNKTFKNDFYGYDHANSAYHKTPCLLLLLSLPLSYLRFGKAMSFVLFLLLFVTFLRSSAVFYTPLTRYFAIQYHWGLTNEILGILAAQNYPRLKSEKNALDSVFAQVTIENPEQEGGE